MFLKNLIFPLSLILILSSCGDKAISPSTDDASQEATSDNETNTSNADLSTWKTISNDLYSIKYPVTWTRNMEVQASVHFALISEIDGDKDTFGENIYLVVKDLFDPKVNKNEDFGLSLDRIESDFIKQVNTLIPNGKVISSERKEMNGKVFHQVVYEGTQEEQNLTFLQRFWLNEGRSYILSYTGEQSGGYKQHQEEALEILNSFTIN